MDRTIKTPTPTSLRARAHDLQGNEEKKEVPITMFLQRKENP
jgi:hypothetical protein